MAKRKQRIKAAAYLRRSTKDQTASIEDQKSAILDYVKRHRSKNFEIVEWYIDDGISGDGTEKRLDFQRMRDDATNGLFVVVICWDQDRFGRGDIVDTFSDIKDFRDAGVSLETVNDGESRWNDVMGRLTYAFKQEGKHQYLHDLSRNVTRGQMEAAKSGSWSGSAPFGYKIVGQRKDKKLVLGNSADVALVIRIFDEYVNQNRSLSEIARRLNDEGIKTGKGRTWRFDSVKFILENDAYVGRMVFNRKSYSKYNHYSDGQVKKGGKRGFNDESDWIVHEDNHEAIIDVVTFDKAQTRIAKGKLGASHRNADENEFLFTGKLFCGRCGAPLWGFASGKYRYYECGKRKRHGVDACEGSTVREDKLLDDMLFTLEHRVMAQDWTDILKARVEAGEELTPKDMPRGFETLTKMFNAQQPKNRGKSIKKQLANIDADLATLERNQMYAKGENTFDRIGAEIERLTIKRDELREQLGDVLTDDDANSIVLSVLEKFSRLTLARYSTPTEANVEIKAAIQELDKIVIFTELKSHGNGRRHTFRRGEIYLFGKSLNRRPRPVKRRTRANTSNLNRHHLG